MTTSLLVLASAETYNSSRGHNPRLHEAPCDIHTHGTTAYTHTQVPHGHPSPGSRYSSDRFLMPSASPLGSQALQTTHDKVRLQ
jgi:hypothetical protein